MPINMCLLTSVFGSNRLAAEMRFELSVRNLVSTLAISVGLVRWRPVALREYFETDLLGFEYERLHIKCGGL
jgi:hypothetical protein